MDIKEIVGSKLLSIVPIERRKVMKKQQKEE